MDFSMLPPEVNSGLMYTGAGSGPVLAAAAAWQAIATQLAEAAQSHQAIADSVAGAWSGPSASRAVSAISPYTTWLSTTSEQAAQTAAQANAFAGAYHAAYAATVPPAVVAANRAQLLMLVATNILGQNTAAIMANEAHYAAMWAQDAVAMNTYSTTAQAASVLPTFTSPNTSTAPSAAPATPATNGIGQIWNALFGPGGDSAGGIPFLGNNSNAILGLNSNFWNSVMSSGAFNPLQLLQAITGFGTFASLASGGAYRLFGEAEDDDGNVAVPFHVPAAAPPPAVSASLGSSAPLSRLSVPPSWASAVQQQTELAAQRALPAALPSVYALEEGAVQTGIPVAPIAPVTSAGRSDNRRKQREDPEYGTVSKVIPAKHPSAG